MSFQGGRSITIAGQCFEKILSRKIFSASFIIFLVSIFLFSSRVIAQQLSCQCGNPISKIQTVLTYANQDEKKFCCTGCGLSAFSGSKEQVKGIRVGDYSTGKLINAEKAYFVEGYYTEPDCCKGAWIPFEKREAARGFLFKNGGMIVDFKGDRVLEVKIPPAKNNVWIYIVAAVLCLGLYFGISKTSQNKGTKLRRVSASALAFVITFLLITALAVIWKPQNFDHRVLRLSLDEQGKHTVIGEVQEIVLKQVGNCGEYDIGFHFFNIIQDEPAKDINIRFLNTSGIDYTFCALDGEKFDKDSNTRLNLGFAHSFNIDILLKVHQKEYIGGIVFSDRKTGEDLINIPVYIVQEGSMEL